MIPQELSSFPSTPINKFSFSSSKSYIHLNNTNGREDSPTMEKYSNKLLGSLLITPERH